MIACTRAKHWKRSVGRAAPDAGHKQPTLNNATKPHLLGLVAGLFLAAGLILSAMLVTRAWLKIAESETISLTGFARKMVRSDLVIWRGSVTAEGNTLFVAQRSLKADLVKVENFIKSSGMTKYMIGPVSIKELQATEEVKAAQKGESNITQQKTIGFRLTQSVEVRSAEVDRIRKVDQDSTTLLEQGVMFVSSTPEYIYTRAGEAKVELLAGATKDARDRAEQISSQGDRAINELRSAKMGVFQITPVYSLQTSWEGVNDTTSLEKTITAVVTASFSMK
jgi:uncharacterized protein